MNANITLYHGSPEVVVVPLPGKGNPHNDFGAGFYCTKDLELAKEWACKGQTLGVANKYSLNLDGMEILDLTSGNYHILNWLAVLLENRNFEMSAPVPSQIKKYILTHFLPEYRNADIIEGYRADDSYFTFAKDFLSNTISLSQLQRAMKLGHLGRQIVLKSSRAFDAIEFTEAIAADGVLYCSKRISRDLSARKEYQAIKSEELLDNAVLASDIVRQKWENDDPRLR